MSVNDEFSSNCGGVIAVCLKTRRRAMSNSPPADGGGVGSDFKWCKQAPPNEELLFRILLTQLYILSRWVRNGSFRACTHGRNLGRSHLRGRDGRGRYVCTCHYRGVTVPQELVQWDVWQRCNCRSWRCWHLLQHSWWWCWRRHRRKINCWITRWTQMCSFLIHMSGNRSFRIKVDHTVKTNKINNVVINALLRNISESVEPQGTFVTLNWRTKFSWIHNRKCLQGKKANVMWMKSNV